MGKGSHLGNDVFQTDVQGLSALSATTLPEPPAAPWLRGPRSSPSCSRLLPSRCGPLLGLRLGTTFTHSLPSVHLKLLSTLPGRLLPCLACLPSWLCTLAGVLPQQAWPLLLAFERNISRLTAPDFLRINGWSYQGPVTGDFMAFTCRPCAASRERAGTPATLALRQSRLQGPAHLEAPAFELRRGPQAIYTMRVCPFLKNRALG